MSKKVFTRFDTASLIDVPPYVPPVVTDIPDHHTDAITSITTSRDGQWVITSSADKVCIVWAFETGEYDHSYTGHTERVTAVACFSDNVSAVSCSLDQTIQIWKIESGKSVRTLMGHSSGVECLALSVDNSRLATGGWDRTCIVWKMDTYTPLHTLTGHTGWVKAVTLSHDNSFVVSGSFDGTCRVWDLDTGNLNGVTPGQGAPINSVCLTADSSTLACASQDNTVRIWRVSTFELVSTIESHSDAVTAVVFGNDDSTLFSASADRTVKSRPLSSSSSVTEKTLKGHTATVSCVAVTADGKLVLSAGSDICVRVWSTSGSVKCLRTIDGRPEVEEEGDDEGPATTVSQKKKKKKKKDKAETPQETRKPRRRRKEAVDEPVTMLNDHVFTFYTKAGLYEIEDMIRRMAARLEIIDGLSMWEQKDFVQTINTIGASIAERVNRCYINETTAISMRFVGHMVPKLAPVAHLRPDIVTTSLDTTFARLTRDVYKDGDLEGVEQMRALMQTLPSQKVHRCAKCLTRIEDELLKAEMEAEAAEAKEVEIAQTFVSS